MKYIDSEKLIAKLTKMQFDLNAAYRHPQSDNITEAISFEYDDILSLVDSLQQEQPEADWEIAFSMEYATYHLPKFILESISKGTELIDFIYETARHFCEFGFNVRKGK